MFGADTFCTRIGNQDRPRATRTGIVAKDEPRQEENLGPGNLFLLTGGGHIDFRPFSIKILLSPQISNVRIFKFKNGVNSSYFSPTPSANEVFTSCWQHISFPICILSRVRSIVKDGVSCRLEDFITFFTRKALACIFEPKG